MTDLPIELKAAYLLGLWRGTRYGTDAYTRRFRAELQPHAKTAAALVLGEGAFDGETIWAMERFYGRLFTNEVTG